MSTLFLVGLPLTKDSATQDFKDFVFSNNQTILITTSVFGWNQSHLNNDYNCAKFGYDFLKSAGFVTSIADYPFSGKSLEQSVEECLRFIKHKTILSIDLWSSLQASRRYAGDVAKDVVALFNLITKKLSNAQVGVISEGDPLYVDTRVKYIRELTHDYKIISSPSSAELCLLELYGLEGVKGLPVVNHEENAIGFYNNSINVYSCLGLYYNKDLTVLMENLSETDTAYVIKLGDDKIVKKHNGNELKTLLKSQEYRRFLMDKTVLVYNCSDPK